MINATCHPNRKHYAKGKCWPCYSRRWNHREDRPSWVDGNWAAYKRGEAPPRTKNLSGPVVRYLPGTPEYEQLLASRNPEKE